MPVGRLPRVWQSLRSTMTKALPLSASFWSSSSERLAKQVARLASSRTAELQMVQSAKAGAAALRAIASAAAPAREVVARLAGASPSTVSRSLRTPDLVKPETRRRVAEAVAKTGYVVNSIATSLRSGQSSFISVLVASLQNVHYAAGVQGMIDAFEGSRF